MCEKPVAANSIQYCSEHLLFRNTCAKELRQEKRNANICLDCEEPATSGSFCFAHFNRRKDKQQERRQKKIQVGLCTRCDNPAASTSDWFCSAHLEIHNAQRIKRAEQKKGLCQTSGCHEPLSSTIFCAKHQEDTRNIKIRLRQSYVSAGTCSKCGQEPLANKTTGRICLAKQAARNYLPEGRMYVQLLDSSSTTTPGNS